MADLSKFISIVLKVVIRIVVRRNQSSKMLHLCAPVFLVEQRRRSVDGANVRGKCRGGFVLEQLPADSDFI